MPQRRTQIADAAIATLAAHGSRGLTHRAVDQAAGLPPGSTSYYLRTRLALLEATVERLAELDAGEVPDLGGADPAGALADALGRLLTDGRDRLLARYELSLEASRRPELRPALVAGSRRIHDAFAGWLDRLGVSDTAVRADAVQALVEGLLLAEATSTRNPPRTREEIRRSLTVVIGAP
ncbi:TetR/AcrR family transcriptional regulator [Georgenia faecalis]|uniref:TetR/AcrR family transcriptional regulator n=1 Tax=Georgenia faecalis TaxID=2483799 RepID=UPI0013DFBDF9|nr:TetR/AcrR family transcriptional regulator [Georgenia faecalis]